MIKAGDRFGKWTVLRVFRADWRTQCVVQCDCGAIRTHHSGTLKAGQSKRCRACNGRDVLTKHGEARSQLYDIWIYIHRFKDVVDKWHTYEAFRDDVGDYPGLEYQLSCVNPNKPYGPNNFEWTRLGVNYHKGKKAEGKSSQYKGVYWHSVREYWVAQVTYRRKRIYLGKYDSEDEAALAYNKKAKELYGEHAYVNKVKEK